MLLHGEMQAQKRGGMKKAKMNNPICKCGAPMNVHPLFGYSECGACLEALKAVRVMTLCDWPECGKKVRKIGLGPGNYCSEHRQVARAAFWRLNLLEGPHSLNLMTPTNAELFEFVQTKQIPVSRRYRVTFENTAFGCARCHGPAIVFNPPDFVPGKEAFYNSAVIICRKCSFKPKAA